MMSANREFEALFEAAGDAVLVIDDARAFIDVNPAACRLLGLERERLLSRRIDEFMDIGCVELDEVWQKFVAGEAQTGELRLRSHDGRIRHVEYTATAQFLPDRHLAILRDVTDRRQAEIERSDLLRREQERLRETQTLLAVSRTLGSTLDPAETMRRVAREIALAMNADMVGAYLADAGHQNLRPIAGYRVPKRFLDAFRRFPIPIKNHPAIEEAWSLGRPVWTDEMASDPRVDPASLARFPHQTDLFVPIRSKDKPIGGFFVIWWALRRRFSEDELSLLQGISDLAGIFLENAQLYQHTADANRKKDQFLATLSHELRNPLGAIANAAQALERPGVTQETAERLHHIMNRQIRHLARLLDDLLDVARVTAGKITLQQQNFDLAEVVQSCVQSLQQNGKASGHTITLRTQSVIVHADATRVEQIVVNLLENAVKYTPTGGRIHVAVSDEQGQAVLRVSDTGVGIAPEMLSAIFDPFTQGDSGVDRSRGGLGIGLTLVRRLVEMHGGEVTATSEGIGHGSQFIVRLPRGSASDVGARLPAVAECEPPRRILVVEDNDDARESFCRLLESLGHRVSEAVDGVQGLALALAEQPDVVLIDLGLPGIDGHEVARRLRATPSGTHMLLVAVSGYGQPEDRNLSNQAGFDAHLTKPVSHDVLSALISGVRVSDRGPSTS